MVAVWLSLDKTQPPCPNRIRREFGNHLDKTRCHRALGALDGDRRDRERQRAAVAASLDEDVALAAERGGVNGIRVGIRNLGGGCDSRNALDRDTGTSSWMDTTDSYLERWLTWI